MKRLVLSVPAVLLAGFASLSLVALAGCGSSGSSSSGNKIPSGSAKNIYAIQNASNNETEQDSVLRFSASATGTTTPTSTLNLPSGFYAYSIAIGPQGQIYIGGTPDNDTAAYGQILEYAAGSTGSATPTVTLNGTNPGATTFVYPIALAVNSAGTLVVSSNDGTLEAFASGLTASSAPTQFMTWAPDADGWLCKAIGVDTAGDIFCLNIYEPPSGDPSNYMSIEVFAAGATGLTTPMHIITGTDTSFFGTLENMAVDGAGDVYVANYNPSAGSTDTDEPTEIIEFAAGASGHATPLKRIGGAATNIVEPWALAVDGAANLYYADANGGYSSSGYSDSDATALLEVFSASATGNVAPTASITATGFTLTDGNSGAVAVY